MKTCKEESPKPFPRQGIEKSLFTWESWDGDMECMTFYDAVLATPIGSFPAGTRVPHIDMDYAHSRMILHEGQGRPPRTFILQLTTPWEELL